MLGLPPKIYPSRHALAQQHRRFFEVGQVGGRVGSDDHRAAVFRSTATLERGHDGLLFGVDDLASLRRM